MANYWELFGRVFHLLALPTCRPIAILWPSKFSTNKRDDSLRYLNGACAPFCLALLTYSVWRRLCRRKVLRNGKPSFHAAYSVAYHPVIYSRTGSHYYTDRHVWMIRRLTGHHTGGSCPRWRQHQLRHALENVVKSSGRKLNCSVLDCHVSMTHRRTFVGIPCIRHGHRYDWHTHVKWTSS